MIPPSGCAPVCIPLRIRINLHDRNAMDIKDFFRVKRVDDFAVIDAQAITAPKGFSPHALLPGFKRIVLFAKQIPDFVFRLEAELKTHYLYGLIREMDSIAHELSGHIHHEGYKNLPLPCFFPIRIKDGKLRGYVSFKHLAERAGMGSIGLNSLLISPKFGNRLCLTALMTEMKIEERTSVLEKPLCLKCNKCVASCPSKAIENGKVDARRCINVSGQVPGVIRPVFNKIVKWNSTKKYAETLINTLSWNINMLCSECLTNCPYFKA